MIKICSFIFLTLLSITSFSQTQKVAILDFENVSGKTEYDAIGKALSAMLITDFQDNIHPKKLEFFERGQLNKVLDEQKLQKSKDFDAKTAVEFGKLSGVNYVLVGSVFVLDGNCNITSKLVEVATSKIILSKAANGKIDALIQLKSELAESIAQQLNNPITLDPRYKNEEITLSTINQYSKVLELMDKGDFVQAEQLRSVFEETNHSFKYYADLKDDISHLKKLVAKNTEDIALLNKSGVEQKEMILLLANSYSFGIKSYDQRNYPQAIKYFLSYLTTNDSEDNYYVNKKLHILGLLAISFLKMDDYENAIKYSLEAKKIFDYYPPVNEVLYVGYLKIGDNNASEKMLEFLLSKISHDNILQARKINNGLIWGQMGEIIIIDENDEEILLFEQIRNPYSSRANAILKINKLLTDYNIKDNKEFLNTYVIIYSKTQKALLVQNPLIFTCPESIDYFYMALDYISQLIRKKEFNEIENVLTNDIKRITMEMPYVTEEIAKMYRQFEDICYILGLKNSKERFDTRHIVFGKLIINQLAIYIATNQQQKASDLYRTITMPVISSDYGRFNNWHWDEIFGFWNRVLKDFEFNRSPHLDSEKLKPKVELEVLKVLKNYGISKFDFNKL